MFYFYNFDLRSINDFGYFISFVESIYDENIKNDSKPVLSSTNGYKDDIKNLEKVLTEKIDNKNNQSKEDFEIQKKEFENQKKEFENQKKFNDDLLQEIRGFRSDIDSRNEILVDSSNNSNINFNEDVFNNIYENQIVIIYLLSVLIFVILFNRFWSAFK